ncbi:uncharacterized protein LOC135930921 [Gordionus sp. m RMFG-2023]|uniref:uncharacterized protein LOC135930921 n=1 Tax=Gordionus sp. m RMFG-2023 TaxID=3053472 RepID=UPI0031FC8EE0
MSLPDLSTASTKSNCPLCNKLVKVTKLGLLPSHRNQKIKLTQSGLPILSPAIPRTLNAFSAIALAQPIVTIFTLTDVPTSPIVPTSTAENALTFNPTDSTDVEIFLVTPKPFVISRIPKGARLQVAKHLSKNLTSLINNYSSIKHWLDTTPCDDTDKNKNHKNDLLTKAKLISKKLDNLNVKSAIRLATSDNKLAPYDQTTYQALLLKHHPHDLKDEIPSYPEAPLIATTFTSSEVRKAILSFKRDSSPGVDGFRPIFLQDLTAPYITQQCDVLEKITQLINRMLAGGLPPAIIPLLYGAKLIALHKPNKDIRPIAIGTTWRRLTAKLVVSRILFTVSNHLCPNQLGVNVKGGCEVSLHMTRMYLQTDPSDNILIKIDFSNAFNSLKRTAFLNPILTLYPEYSQFIFDCYASPSHLQFGDRLIPSSSGIQQGDPLGSFLFCLGINSLIQSINDQCKLNLHNWYIDDGILGGSPSEVIKAVEIIKSN